MSGQEIFIYEFAGFTLEPGERRLLKGGKPVPLTPKVFDTLVFLVHRANRVVSKDDLMKALWPRGYVDEATLTNHIWQIRRVLGDSAKSAQFIETVPKLGYRFTAPVAVVNRELDTKLKELPVAMAPVEPAVAAAIQPGSSDPWRLGGKGIRRLGVALVIAGVVICAGAFSLMREPALFRATTTAAAPKNRTVALIGFNNLSQNAKDAWLAPALTAMLGTELGATDEVHIIPGELVRDASTDLSAPLAAGYGIDTLKKLQTRLNADYVVSGTYLVAPDSADPAVRLDLTLQNTHDAALLVTSTSQLPMSDLNAVVNHAAADLRAKLGVSSPSAEFLGLLINAQPPSTDVARRIGLAIDAMQRYDAARARDETLEAVAEAPGYAPSYLYLARAWTALGYRQKALAAAEQAAGRSGSLPPEMRLQIDATVQTLRYEWRTAAQSWQALSLLKPLTPEYQIESIDAHLAAGQIDVAQRTLEELRRLPKGSGDPRVELAAARIARARSDSKAEAAHAQLALHQAQAREAPGLIADAEVELATAQVRLGDQGPAKAALKSAIDQYRFIGNPRGEVEARRLLAGALDGGQAAREEYQLAMALAQTIGDVGGVAGVYRDLCELLWIAGDRDGAQAAARQALRLSRETGDLRMQSWTLRALATIASDEAASDEVLAQYLEVTALTKQTNDPGGHVWSLATNADLLRMRGDVESAHVDCEQARREAAALSDPQFAIYTEFTCALLAVDRGDPAAARRLLNDVADLADKAGNSIYAANAQFVLAQLDFDESKWAEAREKAGRAAQRFAAVDAQTGEAGAEALVAICSQALGNTVERDAAVARARHLRGAITSRLEVYFVDIALAQISGGTAAPAEAVARLRELAADAERRHWLAWSLDAKLAEWRMLVAQGNSTAAAVVQNDLRTSARQLGFARIIAQLNRPMAAAAL